MRSSKEPKPPFGAENSQLTAPNSESSIHVFQTSTGPTSGPNQVEAVQAHRTQFINTRFTFFSAPERRAYLRKYWGSQPIYDTARCARAERLEALLFAYCVLYDRGGAFLDPEWSVSAKLMSLASMQPAVLSISRDVASIAPEPGQEELGFPSLQMVSDKFFAFSANHPILREIIEEIPRIAPYFANQRMWSVSRATTALAGSGLLTRIVRESGNFDQKKLHIIQLGEDGFDLFSLNGKGSLDKKKVLSKRDRDSYLLLRKGPQSLRFGFQDLTRRLQRGVSSQRQPKKAESALALDHWKTELTVEVGNKKAAAPSKHFFHIPNQVIQTSPSRAIRVHHARILAEFRNRHSDFDHYLFDNDDVQRYMSRRWGDHPIHDVFRRSVFGPMKADIFRYCIVFDWGGYYLDASKPFQRKFSDFTKTSSEGLVTFERNPCSIFPDLKVASRLMHPHSHVAQWAFGFAPQHPVLELAIDRIVCLAPEFAGRKFASVRQGVFALTGPGLFTWAFRRYLENFSGGQVIQAHYNFGASGHLERIPGTETFPGGARTHYASETNQLILKPESPEPGRVSPAS